MPVFIIKMSRVPSVASWSLSCSVLGETKGFSGLQRSMATQSEMIEALKEAGISESRFRAAIEQAQTDAESSFEINQNEAQKLSVLHTDTSE